MLVYYRGAGVWGTPNGETTEEGEPRYISISAPKFTAGIFTLAAAGQRNIKHQKWTEETYLLPCLGIHEDAAPLPKVEDPSKLIFQLYTGGNKTTEVVFCEKHIIPPTTNRKRTRSIHLNGKVAKRIEKLRKQLELLEKTALKKGIHFERKKLLCSKKDLFKWIKSKEPAFEKIKLATFENDWSDLTGWHLCPPNDAEANFFKNISSSKLETTPPKK